MTHLSDPQLDSSNPESAPMSDVKLRIKGFLSRFLRNHDFADDEDIFARGFVNSLLAMQLVSFVEKEFGVTIEDEDLDLQNFRTVDNIAALVASKGGA